MPHPALSHPLAEPKPDAKRAEPPTIGEATTMIFASEDLFRGIRTMSHSELERWHRSETDLGRLQIISALIGCRRAMRAP